MNRLSETELRAWKASLAKDGVSYDSDEEYHEAVSNLVSLFDVLIKIDKESQKSKRGKDDEMYVYDKDGNKVIL